MANLTRLLSRRPRIDEAEVEDVRERTMARLAGLGGDAPGSTGAPETTPAEAVAPQTPVDDVVAATAEVTAASIEPPKPTGPKVIVPRTIALGPPPDAPTASPAHRPPPIIVTGESDGTAEPGPAAGPDLAETNEPAAVTAIRDVAEPPVVELPGADAAIAGPIVETPAEGAGESDLVIALPAPLAQAGEPIEVTTVVGDAAEVVETEGEPQAIAIAIAPEVTAEAIVVEVPAEATSDEPVVAPEVTAEATMVEAVVPAVQTRRKTPKAKPATPKPAKPRPTAKASAAKTPAAKSTAGTKRAKRPPEAVPVKAQPTPVIDPDAVWPGQWLRQVSPDEPVDESAARPQDREPAIVRRDTSLPVPRVAVVADDWDGGATQDLAAVKASAETAVAVAEPVVAEPVVGEPGVVVVSEPVVAEPVVEAVAEPAIAEPAIAKPAAAVAVTPAARPAAAVRKARVATPRKPRPRPTPPATAKTGAARPITQPTTAIAAFCPYCALALEPPPTASRRCTRCRQRIVVKRVQGRVVYLTEAAVEVFDSERIRSANFGRWAKERAQWLKLATSVGADAGRIARLRAAPLSEKVVESSRTLYLSTTERSYREAKREDRWEDASRLKRDQAAALYRLAGSALPPPADVVAMHREAVTAELRGIGKMARDAELVGSTCCATCSADDGRAFKIVTELRNPRLPHDGCPKGLCHCRWEFALRDATMVRRYLKRTRGKPKSPSA